MEKLSNIKEFKSSPELVKILYRVGVEKKHNAGHVFLQEESNIRTVPIIINGLIKVMRSDEDGRELYLYYLRPGDCCVLSLLGGMHKELSKVRLEVAEDAEILFIPVEKMTEFIYKYPQWLDYIFRLYHEKLKELLVVINAVTFRKIDERVLLILRHKSSLLGSNIIHTTHEQLANELGTTRVVISRLLKKLEDNGEVKLGRNKITLV